VLDRLEIVALGLIGETTVEIGEREAGVPADRRIVVAYGQVIFIFPGIGIPPIVVAAGEIRIEPKGGLAIRERQVEFAFVVERRAAIVESQFEAEFVRATGFDDRRAGGDDEIGVRAMFADIGIATIGLGRSRACRAGARDYDR